MSDFVFHLKEIAANNTLCFVKTPTSKVHIVDPGFPRRTVCGSRRSAKLDFLKNGTRIRYIDIMYATSRHSRYPTDANKNCVEQLRRSIEMPDDVVIFDYALLDSHVKDQTDVCQTCLNVYLPKRFSWEIDLGQGHTGTFVYTTDIPKDLSPHSLLLVDAPEGVDQEKVLITGLHLKHDSKTSDRPCSFIIGLHHGGLVRQGRHDFYVTRLVPLSINPSVNCSTCPAHSHIHSGKWSELCRVAITQAQGRYKKAQERKAAQEKAKAVAQNAQSLTSS